MRFAENPDTGELVKQDPVTGDWVPATPADQAAAGADGLEAAFRGAKRTATDLFDLGMLGLTEAVRPLMGGEGGVVDYLLDASKAASQQGLAASQAEREAFTERFPVASRVGENIDLLTAVGGLGAARRGAQGTMRQRIGGRLKDTSGQAFRTADEIASTVGADAFTTNLRKVYNSRLINATVARRIGGEGMEEALQASGGKLTAEVLDEATGNAVRRINMAVPDNVRVELPQSLQTRLARLTKEEEWLEPAELELLQQGRVTGEQVKDLRSALGKLQRNAKGSKYDYVKNTTDMLDRQLKQTAGVNTQLYEEARQSYRAWVALRRSSAAISDEGYINPKSFRNAIRQTYGDAAKRGAYDSFDKDTAEMMRLIDEAVAKGVKTPDSGTSRRLIKTLGAAAAAGAAGGAAF